MRKTNCDNRPLAIEAVGDGSYLYRWDIEEVTTEAAEGQEARTSWNCYEVIVWNQPTENSITEAVVDALWGSGVEQKLINDYYAANEGILDEEYKQPYLDFLAERKAIKAQIAVDFGIWSGNAVAEVAEAIAEE